jgi:hypothetical protein
VRVKRDPRTSIAIGELVKRSSNGRPASIPRSTSDQFTYFRQGISNTLTVR